jgi:hypothetical protein
MLPQRNFEQSKSIGNALGRRSMSSTIAGKGALCAALGWTRPRLELRIESDPNFPIKRRGRLNGTGVNAWEFDIEAVKAYLGGYANAPGDSSQPAEGEALRNNAEAAGGAFDVRERSARQRRESAQAGLLENKLLRQNAALIDRADLEAIMATFTQHIEAGIEGLPAMIAERLGLDDEQLENIRPLTDDLTAKMRADLRPLFRASTEFA